MGGVEKRVVIDYREEAEEKGFMKEKGNPGAGNWRSEQHCSRMRVKVEERAEKYFSWQPFTRRSGSSAL